MKHVPFNTKAAATRFVNHVNKLMGDYPKPSFKRDGSPADPATERYTIVEGEKPPYSVGVDRVTAAMLDPNIRKRLRAAAATEVDNALAKEEERPKDWGASPDPVIVGTRTR